MKYIENKTFDEIKVGDRAVLERTLTPRDIDIFAIMSGDINPAHVDPDYAKDDIFHKVIAHGMWGGALISTVLGTELPGPGTIYLDQSLKFLKPVGIGDKVCVEVIVKKKVKSKHQVIFDCKCTNGEGTIVISGEARVMAPTEKIKRPRAEMPELHLHKRGGIYDRLIAMTENIDPVKTAVIHPCNEISLEGAIRAMERGLIDPVLVGPKKRIEATAESAKLSLEGADIVDTPHSHASAIKAVELVRQGRVQSLMKGALPTREVMAAVIDKKNGLRTERRMSHIYVMDVPTYPNLWLISDAAINIDPDLETKADITQNAIDLAHAMNINEPRVAILSAVEKVYPNILSTVEAGALCKMADRGQISGALLDGPLAFDNAISLAAAEAKSIVSEVAGQADILITPDLEAGNMIAKQLIYLAGADAAGIVLGARVPIMLTSRADKILARTTSAALANLFIHKQKQLKTG